MEIIFNMLYGFLVFLFSLCTFLLILSIMFQKGHGGFWSGPASGGDSTLLFGGNQGIDVLQKTTWFLGFIFMIFAFGLSLYRTKISLYNKYITSNIRVEKKIEKKENDQIELENSAIDLIKEKEIPAS